jgi:hypothetical protein
MKVILILTLCFATTCFSNPILGTWINQLSKSKYDFVEFKEDGTYIGNPLGHNAQAKAGKYEMLADGSGLIIQAYDRAYIVDIRESGKDRLVLEFASSAILLSRIDPQITRKKSDELLEQERIRPYISNLKRIVSAGHQYMLEEGKTSASYDEIKDVFLPNFKPISGESYDHIVIQKKGGKASVTNASGETFEFPY